MQTYMSLYNSLLDNNLSLIAIVSSICGDIMKMWKICIELQLFESLEYNHAHATSHAGSIKCNSVLYAHLNCSFYSNP